MILGFLQGLTEFLPVSSSGHLLLARNMMGLGEMSASFDVFLHIGTLVAVVICLRREILIVAKNPKKIGFLALATVPAVVVGLLLGDFIEKIFYTGNYLWVTFLATAMLLLACEIIETVRSGRKKMLTGIGIDNAAVMGMMQAAALLPGLSRSGCTIFGGVVSGARREDVATFSFLMSIPVILGGAILSISAIDVAWYILLVGMIAAFVGGMLSVKVMLKVIGKANYKWFSLYLAIMSIVSIFL